MRSSARKQKEEEEKEKEKFWRKGQRTTLEVGVSWWMDASVPFHTRNPGMGLEEVRCS